jgi:hypothetical protein
MYVTPCLGGFCAALQPCRRIFSVPPSWFAEQNYAIFHGQQDTTFLPGDGLEFIRYSAHRPDKAFFIDPPYTVAGRRLYTHSRIDHRELFRLTQKLRGDFLMTCDNSSEIRELAREFGFHTALVNEEYAPCADERTGVAAPGNLPGVRVDASSWSDGDGNLWLFGGMGFDSSGALGILNDLWRYSAGEWTWMGGSDTVNQFGTYGTEGWAAPSNAPGARVNAAAWTDADGSLWLFGGEGQDLNGIRCSQIGGACELNDLWKYTGANGRGWMART